MAAMVKVTFADGSPWFTEVGDSKEQVIRQLHARAAEATSSSSRARIDDVIARLQSSR